MTLQEVADSWNRLETSGRAPMTPQRVSDYERWPDGGRRPTPHALRMLSRIYDVDVDRLIDSADLGACDDRQMMEMMELGSSSSAVERADGGVVAGEFEEFVGSEIAKFGASLVYPTFRLTDEVRTAVSGLNEQLLYEKEQSPFTRMHRIDVPVAAAVNDMRALVYVVDLFQSHLRVSWSLQTDTDAVRDPARSIISFGLSSNDCTHMYLETVDSPLFSVVPDEQGSEFLRLADGSEYRSTAGEQFGIVMRARPFPDTPDRVWFLVSGLGPLGTPGAAWYLATNWSELHRRAGAADFVAVVRVRRYSEKSAQLQHVYVAGQPRRSS